MAFCAKCGAQVNEGSAFCPACGAATSGTSAASSGTAVAPAPATATTSTGMTNNVAGMLCYLVGWITGLIFLLIDPYKNDRFVKFHAFQSIFWDVAFIVLCIAATIAGGVLGVVSHGFAALIMFAVWPLLWLAWFGVKILLMVKAYNNQLFKLPFVGDLAAKQAGV